MLSSYIAIDIKMVVSWICMQCVHATHIPTVDVAAIIIANYSYMSTNKL